MYYYLPITGNSYGSRPVIVYIVGASPILHPFNTNCRCLSSTPGIKVKPRHGIKPIEASNILISFADPRGSLEATAIPVT